jgi:hypothetical protein
MFQQIGSNKVQNGIGIGEIEDLVHNFLIIMLEHSMWQKDGWKDIEANIHCAEWLAMIGGSSTGEQRIRCEKSLPKTLYDPFSEGTVFVRRFWLKLLRILRRTERRFLRSDAE